MNVIPPAPYQVEAFNTSKASENKIHDDAVARRFGFSGGLVPGVDVYGYMAHQPVARWGRAWLERGTAECRLLKPVYDGETATVTAKETADGLALQVTSRGMLCATGTAALPDAAGPVPALDLFPPPPPPPDDRPPADEASLAVGTLLGIRPLPVTPDFAAGYLRDVRETDPLYAREGLVHPATILRTGNWVLSHNVVLGPWIHVGSTVRHFPPPGSATRSPRAAASPRTTTTRATASWRWTCWCLPTAPPRWRTSRTPRSIVPGRWPRRASSSSGRSASQPRTPRPEAPCKAWPSFISGRPVSVPADPLPLLRGAASVGGQKLERVGHADEHIAQCHREGTGNRKDDEHHHPGDKSVFQRDHCLPVAPQAHPPRRPRFLASRCTGIMCRGAGQSWMQRPVP